MMDVNTFLAAEILSEPDQSRFCPIKAESCFKTVKLGKTAAKQPKDLSGDVRQRTDLLT